jgi:hypothetical protein
MTTKKTKAKGKSKMRGFFAALRMTNEKISMTNKDIGEDIRKN